MKFWKEERRGGQNRLRTLEQEKQRNNLIIQNFVQKGYQIVQEDVRTLARVAWQHWNPDRENVPVFSSPPTL